MKPNQRIIKEQEFRCCLHTKPYQRRIIKEQKFRNGVPMSCQSGISTCCTYSTMSMLHMLWHAGHFTGYGGTLSHKYPGLLYLICFKFHVKALKSCFKQKLTYLMNSITTND